MIDVFGVGQVFWIYGVFNVLAWLFVWRRMPELTGHSLEDIERRLQDGKFRPADFAAGWPSGVTGGCFVDLKRSTDVR